MTLARLLYIFGFLLIVYAVISGLNVEFSSDFEESTFESSYSLKVGSFLIGVLLIIIGRKSKKV